MALKDLVNKLFNPPKEPPQRRSTDSANVDAARRAEVERKTEAAINKTQGDVLRTNLTPERTPYGTQPQRPPTDQEARAEAERRVTGKSRTPEPPAAKDKDARKGPPEAGKHFDKADPLKPDPPVKDDGKDKAEPARELLEAEKVSEADRSGPLESTPVTEPYVEDIITLQAGQEVQAAESADPADWTPEQRATAREARIAELQAERAAEALTNTHSHDGGRTI